MLTRVRTAWARVKQLHRDWEGAYPRWMRLSLAIGICVLVGWLFSGCEARGIKIDQDQLVAMEKGKTTYEQVRLLYGKPQNTLLRDDGSRQVTFDYTQTQRNPLSFIPVAGAFIRSGSTEHASTVFEFDPQGLLLGYSSMQGETVVGTGFVSGARQ
jgi:outer membrane protein assembly factor BamE (lipoprotein component of BamABCDE complex)